MFKKIKVILGIAALTALCAGLAACAKENELDKYQKQGYDVTITYDLSGGKLHNRDGVTIVRMYKSEDYMTDGKAEIKLSDPSVGANATVPTKSSPLSFFAGWYKTREICKSANDKPVDEKGNELVEVDGSYYISGTENDKDKVTAQPKYVYSDYWDFENDRFSVTEETADEDKSITLYAGWVPYYQFDYYYQSEDGWKLYGSTSFDYKAVNAEGSTYSDYDMLYVPEWQDGAMSYSHKRSDNTSFDFPDVSNSKDWKNGTYTFSAAYEDEACTKPINGSLKHPGTLDAKTYSIVDNIKNIYVVYDKFELYKISTAAQLNKYAKPSARYELLADLDFTNLSWPAAFSASEFTGEFASSEGNEFKIINATAYVDGEEAQLGGLFGGVAASAKIKNVIFENATVDFAKSSRFTFSFGLFSGSVNDNAEISGVTVGGLVRIGAISAPASYEFNLLTNGKKDGLTNTGISLQVYGENNMLYFDYAINPDKVTVNEATGDVTIAAAYGSDERNREKENFDIISLWRQNND